MQLALAEARRALGRSFPNPAVGAVLFRGERVLGRGRTQPPGGPHAEVVALERAARRHGPRALRGASLAVTLEPCCHVGRTGPCTEALIAAGVGRVYVGHRDPHPEVDGGGLRRLRRAGIEVELGVLEAACREQHRGFLSRVERGRPFVTLKLAASLDGRIATAGGESRWISGPLARAAVHRLRERIDAILVGAETALADDPELTARRGRRVLHRPRRVLVDSRLRVPATARLFADPGRALVLCGRDAPAGRRRALERRGVRVLPLPRRGRHLPLRAGLERVAGEGVGTVLVEGGGTLAAALLRAGLADELIWVSAPLLLGGDARPALGPLHLARLAAAPRLEPRRIRRLGADLWVEAALPARSRGAGARR
jgi:diaminohydroxyphosphoribosylaminopyrimidine deaminase/5-amino-6-(5-phosphoribosylamino)uracil reductase